MPENPVKGRLARSLFQAGATGLVAALVLGAFSTAGIINMTAAYSMLAGAWIVSAIVVVFSEQVSGLSGRRRILIGGAAILLLGAIFAGLMLFVYVYHPREAVAKSHLQIERMEPIKNAALPQYDFRLHFKNSSDIPSDAPLVTFAMKLAEERLSEKDENEEMARGLAQIKKRAIPRVVRNEVLKDHDMSILLEGQSISDDDFENVTHNHKVAYLFLIFRYIDKNTPPGACHQTEFCGFFMGSFSAWNQCYGHNITKDCE